MTDAAGRRTRGVAIAGVTAIVVGVAVGVVSAAGASPADPVLGFAALGTLVAAPGVLALLGRRGRADLWLPAGVAAFPLAFVSFAGLTLLLLPVAVTIAMAWVRHPYPHAGSLVRRSAVTTLVVVLLLGAAAALFVRDDPASWTTATGGGSTSDVITNGEALLSLFLATLAVAAGWAFTEDGGARRSEPVAS